MPTETDLAWAAGFIDGEGSVGIYGKSDRRIGASQSMREPLDKLASMFGGNVKEDRRREGHLGSKKMWKWEAYGDKARDAALLLIPYAMVKRPQLELLSTCPREAQDREAFASAKQRIKELNSGRI